MLQPNLQDGDRTVELFLLGFMLQPNLQDGDRTIELFLLGFMLQPNLQDGDRTLLKIAVRIVTKAESQEFLWKQEV